MNFGRVKALVIRYVYLYPRSIPRLMDVLFWPVLDLLIWGFLAVYLDKLNLASLNIVAVLLGAIIYWEFLSRSQHAVTIAFLEDVWERNLLNLFVTPVRISEFLAATVVLGFVRIIMQGVVLGILAFLLYSFNIFQFGIYTIPFLISLLIFGWILGIVVVAIILRYGTNAQMLAFGIIFLIQPFSAVFYPVTALPTVLQWVANLLPSTYVFEGMRTLIATGIMPLGPMLWSFGLNAVYLALALWFFYRMFAKVKEKGLLLKLEA